MVSISNSNQTRKLCFLVILNKKNFVETKNKKHSVMPCSLKIVLLFDNFDSKLFERFFVD